jgi:hypothetical protein
MCPAHEQERRTFPCSIYAVAQTPIRALRIKHFRKAGRKNEYKEETGWQELAETGGGIPLQGYRCTESRQPVLEELYQDPDSKLHAQGQKGGVTMPDTNMERERHSPQVLVGTLSFDADREIIPFAFKGIQDLHRAGYEQPPASDYRLVCDSELACPEQWKDTEILEQISAHYKKQVPEGYKGRPLASSDVVELDDGTGRRYFYIDGSTFEPVRFSPFLAKK